MRLVLRQGEGLTRTRTEIAKELQDKLMPKRRHGRKKRRNDDSTQLSSIAFVTRVEALADEPFEKNVRPFLQTYCISCHGEETQKGKIRLDHSERKYGGPEGSRIMGTSLEAIESGKCPPTRRTSFPPRRKPDWCKSGSPNRLPRAGLKVEDKADKEGYGNLVPHDLLFSPAESKRCSGRGGPSLAHFAQGAANTAVRGARTALNLRPRQTARQLPGLQGEISLQFAHGRAGNRACLGPF